MLFKKKLTGVDTYYSSMGYMLISPLKILFFLLLLPFFSATCKAQDDNAPAKFYDGLLIELERSDQHHTAKEANSNKIYDSDQQEQELNQAITAHHPKISRQKYSSENADLKTISDVEDDKFDLHTVEKNETLYSIALRFKVTPELLSAWNAISSPNQLYLGQKLKIFKNKQKHSVLKSLKKQLEITENLRESSQKTSIISINNKNMLKFYCHWPAKGKIIKTFSQTGGRGIEISGKTEQAIKATADGKVVAVSPGIYGHGIFIVIEHAEKVISSYANNSRALVKTGQAVAEGQKIAEMGRIGRKPPSLEFEIRKNGVLVNPMLCLPKKT